MKKVNIYYSQYSAAKFLALRRTDQLAELLGVSLEELFSMVSEPSYRTFYIPKRSGGLREINSPEGKLSKIQRLLSRYLNAIYLLNPHPAVFGFVKESNVATPLSTVSPDTLQYFVKKRTIIGNARSHLRKKYVLNIDLSDFFGSCSATRVRQLFLRSPFHFDMELATCLALITTYRKKLPAGAPSSPILTNFMANGMDKQLSILSEQFNFIYTRYADDLTFSSDVPIKAESIQQIRQLIDACGFRINFKKFRLQKSTARQEVTGIKVNQKLNVDRKYVRNLRALLFQIEKNGFLYCAKKHFTDAQTTDEKLIVRFRNLVIGRIDFLGQVRGKEDDIYLRFLYRFESCT